MASGIATATATATFGDMNGPLLYWGPTTRTAPPTGLSLAEQSLLLRLRNRFERGGDTTISQVLNGLLAEAPV